MSHGKRVRSARAIMVFLEIKLAQAGTSPAVGISVLHDEDGFRVRIGGSEGDETLPGLTVKFSTDAPTPPELFRALFECALYSAGNKGRPAQ